MSNVYHETLSNGHRVQIIQRVSPHSQLWTVFDPKTFNLCGDDHASGYGATREEAVRKYLESASQLATDE